MQSNSTQLQFMITQLINFQISPIHTEPIKKVVELRKPTDCTELLFDPIPRPDHTQGNCGDKKLPFNRKKPPSEPEPGRAAICLDQLGAERTGKRGQQAP